eukprot:9229811-Lingulodinium_polyedra.AAC.1
MCAAEVLAQPARPGTTHRAPGAPRRAEHESQIGPAGMSVPGAATRSERGQPRDSKLEQEKN